MRSTTEPVRAGRIGKALREPAGTAARSTELVERLLGASCLRTGPLGNSRSRVRHWFGMTRWLAGRLPGHCNAGVLYDRDEEILERALATPPRVPADGYRIAVDARADDITLLHPVEPVVSGPGRRIGSAR